MYNMCINYSFLQFYYCRTYLKFKKAGHVLALDGVYLTKKKEVISFARSKVTEVVPNISSRSREPDHAPLAGHSCSPA